MGRAERRKDAADEAVRDFAINLLRYVEDGSVVELRHCGFVEELRQAADPERDDESDDEETSP